MISAVYKNLWHRAGKPEYGPAMYSTDAQAVRVGKYLRYHVISSSNPAANQYDYVLDGVCVAQMAGPKWTAAQIDAHRKLYGRRAS